ncbi:hypothetical protein HBIAX_02052 [Achromobacter xylosoxidans]|nr:hypothetical protein HBIAX_02052 [Achromobacter xylosoxidans]
MIPVQDATIVKKCKAWTAPQPRRLKNHSIALSALLAALSLSSGALAQAPLQFTDMLGNPVTQAAPSTRAVSLPMPGGTLLMSLDGGTARHLVGMHPDSYARMADPVPSRLFPHMEGVRSDITRSGFVPNVETLLQIQPDMVWQWGHMGDDLIAPLRNAGLPVAALLYGTEVRTREWIRLMGHSLGQDARAARQLAWRDDVRAQILAVTGGLRADERPGVLYLSRYRPQLRTSGAGSSFDDDIQLTGGRNVAASVVGTGQTVGIEQVMAWAPDVILLNNFESGLTPAMIYADPLFADIPAVRSHRVYLIPAGGYIWDPPSQESPLYWQWLSQLLHPGRFDWPLREHIAQAYAWLYGQGIGAADIDIVLRMRLNQGGAGYDRLR